MRVFFGLVWVIGVLLLQQSSVQAQEQQELPPPPPPAGEEPASMPAEGEQCVPACRAGFVCHDGQCISACNPPCAAGESCVDGDCRALESPAPPSYPGESTSFDWSDEEAAPPPMGSTTGVEEHDGFMLRLALGVGGGSASEDLSVSGGTGLGVALDGSSIETMLSGVAGSFSIDLGGSVAENLVLHGRLSDFVIVNPTVSVDGTELGEAEDASLGFILLAPALTYYVMPVNLYFTVAVGVTWGRLDVDGNADDNETSNAGIGANLDLGKEWWVGDDWGLGLAGRFWFSRVTDEASAGGVSASSELNLFGGAVLFSATYQ